MLIRQIHDRDIPAVAALFRALASEFIVHESTPDGAATFLRENDEEGLRGFIARGHVCHVAEIDGEIVGYIAVRERRHLFHMFVAKRMHGQGIARELWAHARRVAIEDGHDGVFTVNASNYAVQVYEALGFVRTADTQCVKGLYFNPMQLTESASHFVRTA